MTPAGLGRELTDIEIYDRSVAAYLVGITEKLVYAPTSKARREVTKQYSDDEKKPKDHVPWSFMSFYRHPQFTFDPSRDGFPQRLIGDNVGNVMVNGMLQSTHVKALPINLTYSVDIWSGTHHHVLKLATELATRLYFNQRVLTSPVDVDNELARFSVLDIDWTDNSDIESEEEYGRIYRHTFTFSIDAVVKSVVETTHYPIDISKISMEIYEGDDINAQVCTECDFRRLHPEM